jgi:hypothetical protein
MFLFRLARELKMPVGELGARMDSREISEWMAFFSVEAEEAKADRLRRESEARLNRRRRG